MQKSLYFLKMSSFHQKVRKGYLELAKKYPDRYVIIDASDELDLQECLRKADEAMYLTKWSQKGNTGNS